MKVINIEAVAKRVAEKKLTLQEMSEALGYKHASTFLKYLQGEYKFKADHVPILLQKLDLTMEELFFENNFAKLANKRRA